MSIPRYGFLLPLLLPPLVPLGWWLGGGWIVLLPVLVWGVLPFVDWWIGPDTHNPPADDVRTLENDRFYRWAVWVQVPAVIGLVVWAAWAAQDASLPMWFGLALGTGLVSGAIGITVAHELGHRRSRVERFMAQLLLCWVAYMHFYVEHNKGHHARVGTPEDPATARYGESFWAYFPRTLKGQFRSAWRIDPHRTALSVLATAAIAGGLGLAFGVQAIAFYFVQAYIAVSQLELVNYVEHYGLRRSEVEPGRYERIGVQHSWNSSHKLSNLMLFNLQRHAHHHVHQGKRYQLLEHLDEAPQLPAGYLAMVPLALFTPLWRRVIDPRIPAPQRT